MKSVNLAIVMGRPFVMAIVAAAAFMPAQRATAAWANANFKGGKDATGRYYYDDAQNWSGVSPKYTTNATDPGFGLSSGTQWFAMTNDFTSTRLVVQASDSNHGIDLGGHTLTMKGSIRHYQRDNSFTVTNGTLSIPSGPYQVSSYQANASEPYNPKRCALYAAGPTTTLDLKSLELSLGSSNKVEIGGGATVKATLDFGTKSGPRAEAPFKGNKILVTGSGTVFSNKTSEIGMFSCGYCIDNCIDFSNGARVKALNKLYVCGSGNAVRFADGALPVTPDCLSITNGVSNAIEIANSTFPTTLKRLNVTGGRDQRISVTDGSHLSFEGAFAPLNGPVTGCVFEVTGGAVFARTNGNVMTSVSGSAAARDNVIRVAGTGSRFLFDAYVHLGENDSHETLLIEQGGAFEYALRNSGCVYIGQQKSDGNALVVRNPGSRVHANQVMLAARGASFCRVDISDGAVVTNRSSTAIGYWKRDPADSQFSNDPGGTNTYAITSGGTCYAAWMSTSGVGNTIALTNGTLALISSCELVSGTTKKYSLAVPDPILETEAALAKLKTVPRDTKIMIGGTNSVIRGGNMRFAKGTEFSFAVPSEGYVQTPLQSSGAIELIDCGKVSFDVAAFFASHPKESVVLMETVGGVEMDQTSRDAFNAAAGDRYKVALVNGKSLVLKPKRGLTVVVR